MVAQDRITTENWDLYDTRHAVFARADVSRRLGSGYRARIAISTDGDRLRAAPRRTTASSPVCARGLRGRLEEVRADVGSRDPRQAGRHDAPGAETILSEFGRRKATAENSRVAAMVCGVTGRRTVA
jgi:hypothetical protein